MTCREKLKIEYPDAVSKSCHGGCYGCPNGYGYLPDPEYCKHIGDPELCTNCWDREIPELKETKEEVKMNTNKTYTVENVCRMNEYEKIDLIMELQKDKANRDNRIIKLEKENIQLKDKIVEGDKIADGLFTNIEAHKCTIDAYQKKFIDLERDMIILKDTVSDRESLIEKIKKDNTEICNCIKKNNETIGSLKKENEKLKRERDLLNLDTGRLNDEIKEKVKEIEKIKNERDWLESCYRSWVEESGSRAEKIKKLEKEKDDLDHILHSKIEALEGDIECRKKDLEYKDEQINHLIERLDDQRKKIEDLENDDVLPYFIRKVVGDKLKEDPCCWATPAEKRSYIEEPVCKSVPCSEAIKQLEKKVDDIPCVKAKIKPVGKFIASCWNDGTGAKAKEAYDYIIEDMKRTRELYDKYCVCKWVNNDSPYDKIAKHMMRKYKALRDAGFDHDTALSFIPMWSDD